MDSLSVGFHNYYRWICLFYFDSRGSRLGGYQSQSYDTAADSSDLDYKVRYEILVTALQKLVQAAAEVDVSYPSPYGQRWEIM